MRSIDRASRAAGWLALGCLALAAGSVLVFAVGTLRGRLPEYVEGQVLFDASRMRDHLRLYVDPLVGSYDYGPVPARYYVVYVPIWAWLVSFLPAGAAAPGARAIDLCAWYGMLAWIAWRSAPDNRKIAGLAVAFSASCFALVSYAASARPDAVPVVLAGIALWRATRDRRVDGLGGVLLALAAWTKPNVVGIGLGLLGWPLLTGQRRDWRGLAGALVTSVALAILLQVFSSGEWLHHLVVSIDQPRTLSHLAGQLTGAAPAFLVPLGAAVYWGARNRRDPAVRVAFPALLASVCWTLFSLSKLGTSENHWLEPSLAAVILVARAPVPRPSPSRRSTLILVAAIQAVVTASTGIRASVEAVWLAPRRASVVARARRICGAGPGDMVIAPDVGIEYAMNGRILTTPFEITYLARRGAYPLSLWMDDVVDPHVRGLVMENDVLERSSRAAASYDRLDPPLRALLARTFVLAEEESGLRVYRRRSGVAAAPLITSQFGVDPSGSAP
jgi:hypothetical protein